MNAEFLFYANLVLLLRLGLLLSDESCGAKTWGLKTAAELLGLMLFVPQKFLWVAAVIVLLMNLAGGLWDRRQSDRNVGHLAIGLGQLVGLSICFSSAAGVMFRPELLEMAQRLAAWSTMGAVITGLFDLRVLTICFGMLLAANEANLAIRAVLGGLQLKPNQSPSTPKSLDRGEYNRGRVIGLLERILIYSFVLSGQFGAIGFTLAAKGFTRFKEMEDRGFAEYVLIGTLLSSGLAMGLGVLVKFIL